MSLTWQSCNVPLMIIQVNKHTTETLMHRSLTFSKIVYFSILNKIIVLLNTNLLQNIIFIIKSFIVYTLYTHLCFKFCSQFFSLSSLSPPFYLCPYLHFLLYLLICFFFLLSSQLLFSTCCGLSNMLVNCIIIFYIIHKYILYITYMFPTVHCYSLPNLLLINFLYTFIYATWYLLNTFTTCIYTYLLYIFYVFTYICLYIHRYAHIHINLEFIV